MPSIAQFNGSAAAMLFAALLSPSLNADVASAQTGEGLLAETEDNGESRQERQSRVDRRGAVRLVGEFDEDGSRGLDVFELAAAIRERREQRREERAESEEEREARPETGERPPSPREIAERLIEEFDRNGDGELNGLEAARMIEELRRRERRRQEERESEEGEEEAEEGEEQPREERRPPRRREREGEAEEEGGESEEGQRPERQRRGERERRERGERERGEREEEERQYPLPRPF